MNDHDYVNFSQEHELNYRLRRVDKRQTQKNRDTLITLGKELKASTGKARLTHGEFHEYVLTQLYRLD